MTETQSSVERPATIYDVVGVAPEPGPRGAQAGSGIGCRVNVLHRGRQSTGHGYQVGQ